LAKEAARFFNTERIYVVFYFAHIYAILLWIPKFLVNPADKKMVYVNLIKNMMLSFFYVVFIIQAIYKDKQRDLWGLSVDRIQYGYWLR